MAGKNKQDSDSSTEVGALSKAAAKRELKRLAREMHYHDARYYQEDAPEISDQQYDQLRARNAAIEERFPDFVRKDSPSRRIGAAPAEGFQKVKHRVAMAKLART